MKTVCAVLLLTFASIVIACGGGSDTDETPAPSPTAEPAAEIPVVEIAKTEDGFEAPDSIPGGLTRFRVHNATTGDHGVSLQRFRGDGTLEELDAAYHDATDFAASAAAIEQLTTVEGGTGIIAPGGEAEVVLDLAPGRYAIVRFPLGTHMREMEVTAAPDVRPAPPESAFTVGMVEFAYAGVPDTLPAGRTTMEVVNEGEQVHLMHVRRVNEEGITAEQVSQSWSGTPQPVAPTFTAAGGMNELEPGDSGWVTLDLEPGVYSLICTIFDQHDGELGQLHVVLGMHREFTVQ